MAGDQGENKETVGGNQISEVGLPVPPPKFPPIINPSSSYLLESPTIEKLIEKVDPNQLVSFLKQYDDNRSGIGKIKAENDFKIRAIGMLSVVVTAIAVLVYSGTTGNRELPEKVLIAAISVIAGFGAAGALQKQKDEK
jgi:hypothetical protein